MTKAAKRDGKGLRTLAIDIGGTGLKASVLDEEGKMLHDRVSVGFPGVVRNGKVRTAANLGHDAWLGFDLAKALEKRLGKPTRVINDADMQGLAVVKGKGVELVITLGTGFGTALYLDGKLAPHLELAHHPFRKGESYEEQLGNPARKDVGAKKWNKRIQQAIETMRLLVHFDHLYIGGGNAKKIAFTPDPDVSIISNEAGIRGGVALWRD